MGLKRVKKTVNRGGKTFKQTYYVADAGATPTAAPQAPGQVHSGPPQVLRGPAPGSELNQSVIDAWAVYTGQASPKDSGPHTIRKYVDSNGETRRLRPSRGQQEWVNMAREAKGLPREDAWILPKDLPQ